MFDKRTIALLIFKETDLIKYNCRNDGLEDSIGTWMDVGR